MVGGTASYIFTGCVATACPRLPPYAATHALTPGRARRTDADAEAEPGFYSGGATAEAAAKVAAAAHIGIEQSRTIEVPDSTVGFLLAAAGKQIKALEDATGCRVVVDREGRGARDAAHRASADVQPVRKVTLAGDETALREGERRLQELVLASGKNVQRTIKCNASQAGALIGRGGAVIKRLQAATNTLINVSGREAGGSGDPDAPRTVSITGPAWNVELASRFVFASMRDPAELNALMADAEAAQAAGAGGGGTARATNAGSGYGDAEAFAAVYGTV